MLGNKFHIGDRVGLGVNGEFTRQGTVIWKFLWWVKVAWIEEGVAICSTYATWHHYLEPTLKNE